MITVNIADESVKVSQDGPIVELRPSDSGVRVIIPGAQGPPGPPGSGGGGAAMMEGTWTWVDTPVGDPAVDYQGDGKAWFITNNQYALSLKDANGVDHSLMLFNLKAGDTVYAEEGPNWDCCNGVRTYVTDTDSIDDSGGNTAAATIEIGEDFYWPADGMPLKLSFEFGQGYPQGSFRWSGSQGDLAGIDSTPWAGWWGSVGGTVSGATGGMVPDDATHLFFSHVDLVGVDSGYLLRGAQVGDLIKVTQFEVAAEQPGGNVLAKVTAVPYMSNSNAAFIVPVTILQAVGEQWRGESQLSLHPGTPTDPMADQVYRQPDGIAPQGVEGSMWIVQPGEAQPASYAEVISTIPGLVAYYPLNDYYKLTDVVGGRNAANGGGVTFTAKGAVFTGAPTSYLQIADADVFSATTTGSLTIVASMTVDDWADGGRGDQGFVHWMGKGETGQYEWGFRHYFNPDTSGEVPPRDKRTSFYHWNPAGGLGAGSYFQDNEPAGIEHSVAGQVTGTSASGGITRIWKDAIQRDEDLLSGYSITPVNGTAPVRIGTRDRLTFFKGRIRRVAFFNRMLTGAELLSLKEAASRPEGNWSGGAIVPAAKGFFSGVRDTFDTALGAVWTDNNLASVVNGECRITTQTTAGARISTAYAYTLKGSSCGFKILPPVNTAGGTPDATWVRARINVAADTTTMLDVIIRPMLGTINVRNVTAFTDGDPGAGVASMTYDAAKMQYFRFRELGGSVFWEVSPDGSASSWKTIRTDPTPAWLTAAPNQRLYIDTIKPGAGAATYAVVDNVNSAPNVAAAGYPLRVHDGGSWWDTGGAYLPLSGGTVTGPVTVNADFTVDGSTIEIEGSSGTFFTASSRIGMEAFDGKEIRILTWDGAVSIEGAGIYLSSDNPIRVQDAAGLNPQRLTGLAEPVDPDDAATKAYVDSGGGGGGNVTLDDSEVQFLRGNLDARIGQGYATPEPTILGRVGNQGGGFDSPAYVFEARRNGFEIPGPTLDTDAATKAYVDGAVAVRDARIEQLETQVGELLADIQRIVTVLQEGGR